MKKFVLVLPALILTFCMLTACAVSPAPSAPDAADDSAAPDIVIRAADCFDSMYGSFVTEKSGSYTFTTKGSDTAQWAVYVFDEEFPDALRFISQAAEPALEGDGTVSIEAGKYVYVYCPVNGFTADAPDENASLEIVVSE